MTPRLGATLAVALLAATLVACTDGDDASAACGPFDDRTVARVWNDQALAAIRLDFPAPTVHARNLFHLSAALFDVWAAYDGGSATPVFVDRDPPIPAAGSPIAARDEALAFAGHTVLADRYAASRTPLETLESLDAALRDLCGDLDLDAVERGTPAAFGIDLATEILRTAHDDGSNETAGYVDETYEPVNPPLVVTEPGTTLADPNRWQPLELSMAVTQNGLPEPAGVQRYLGPHWGRVRSFSLPPDPSGLPLDPGPPPMFGTDTHDEFVAGAVEVIEASAALEVGVATIDVGGVEVDAADHHRAIAEFWADGPDSETPPGHWNVLAGRVSDALGDDDRRIGGTGDPVDRLTWDVHLGLALNGALHDAAIAAWGAKAFYDYVRPISMIRHLGGLGQSTDEAGSSYDPMGLPLRPGLIEVVTEASSAPGERHAPLADHVGDVAIRAWRGSPDDPETEVAGVGWIRAIEWVPYQRATFVTPAFAGYVSGHSTFSRAAADVLTAFTGSDRFPAGAETYTIEAGTFLHEDGPTEDLTLVWETFRDAADEAGRSRIHGGIHVSADDLRGRVLGAEVAELAWAEARRHFG